ncbi:MAG: hypothetical protein HQ546_09625 [Planctomycetes bacterium]|nr:hypothetical protein [Planctomycetota bacterium]
MTKPADKEAGIAPHVLVEMDEEAQDAFCRLRYCMEVMPPPPASRPTTTGSATSSATSLDLARLKRVDRQLAEAVRLLKNPEAIEAILNKNGD